VYDLKTKIVSTSQNHWDVPSGFLMFSSASSWSEPSERRVSQGCRNNTNTND